MAMTRREAVSLTPSGLTAFALTQKRSAQAITNNPIPPGVVTLEDFEGR